MFQYIAKRLLGLLPVLFGITLLVFTFLHLIPGDPATVLLGERGTPEQVEVLRARLGLNQPLPLQYLAFLWSLLRFDLGNSIISGIPIIDEIRSRWPATLELSVVAMLVALFIGIPAGILAAVRKNSWLDNLAMRGSLIGVSLPVYWLGLMLIYLFAVYLKWLPPSGRISVDLGFGFKSITGVYVLDALLRWDLAALRDAIAHLILPALTLGTIPLAIIARITRSAMLEVLFQDYIRTARAKGLGQQPILFLHALKNAAVPIVTVIGIGIALLIGGAGGTESVFVIPGPGRLPIGG